MAKEAQTRPGAQPTAAANMPDQQAEARDINPEIEEGFRAIEMAWLQEHQAELAREYPGEWIAIDGPELVAHSPDLPALLSIASEKGHPHPFVTAVPRRPTKSLHV